MKIFFGIVIFCDQYGYALYADSDWKVLKDTTENEASDFMGPPSTLKERDALWWQSHLKQ